TRAVRDPVLSRHAQGLRAAIKARSPTWFVHRSMNERVYNRIMEAGARALERERHAELAAQLGRLPERDERGLSVADIARGYALEAPTAGIEQVRLMNRDLRELAHTQAVAERDIAAEDRKALGLRFQAASDLEKEHNTQLSKLDHERHTAIDQITHTLTQRERELIDKGAEQAARELQQQIDTGRINLETGREHFQGLAYSLGKNQELERRTEREAAARSPEPAEKLAEQLREKEAIRQEKDGPVMRQIGAIGAVVEHETGRRQRAELNQLALDVNRERFIAQGLDPNEARLRAATIPTPVLRDSDRGRDPKELARELPEREREEHAAHRRAMNDRIASLVEKGVPADAAQAVVYAQLSSPGSDLRSNREREVDRVQKELMARGIPPEIARAAAEGRIEEPPHVTRARADEARGRERGRDLGGRER
ncbi:hypothetical protein, partial [Micromonospora sp. NPDC048169]|uniref:hypothetical protein n=1 Tax=Micromonospora sp. NPDC048169 TaxID=3154711 RepID=UPI0033CF8BE9